MRLILTRIGGGVGEAGDGVAVRTRPPRVGFWLKTTEGTQYFSIKTVISFGWCAIDW